MEDKTIYLLLILAISISNNYNLYFIRMLGKLIFR